MLLVDLTTTPAADLPLPEFKAHLKIGRGFGDDGIQDEVLESYLRAAIAAIESRTGKVVMSRRLAWTITRWSQDESQPLPLAPVNQLHSLVLTPRDGADTVLEASEFSVIPDAHRPHVRAKSGHLPVIPNGGSATLTVDAGYGAFWGDIPAELRQAVFLLAANYYENRSDATGAGGLMPFGVMALLEPFRNIRLLGGLS